MLNGPNRTRAPLTPIIAGEWLERLQIEFIDLRHEADGHEMDLPYQGPLYKI